MRRPLASCQSKVKMEKLLQAHKTRGSFSPSSCFQFSKIIAMCTNLKLFMKQEEAGNRRRDCWTIPGEEKEGCSKEKEDAREKEDSN